VRLFVAALLLVALACLAQPVVATGGDYAHSATTPTYSATSSHSSSSHSTNGSHSNAAPWVHRDSHGKIARDPRQLNAFKKQRPCPSTGKTYGSHREC
jgi:hypothetical protein